MTRLPAGFFVEDIGGYRIARKSLKRERSNEFRCAVRQNDMHIASGLPKLAGKIGGFIRSNRSGDTKDDGHSEEFKEYEEFGINAGFGVKCNRKSMGIQLRGFGSLSSLAGPRTPCTPLFYVRHLFSDLLQFSFRMNHELRDFSFCRISAQGVQFPTDFLAEKFERPADGIFGFSDR